MADANDPGVDRLLAKFPKQRPPLPPEVAAIYTSQQVENRTGGSTASSLAQRLEAWMHRQVAADVRGGAQRSTLELGAGSLNQLAYEPAGGTYDVVEPFQPLLDQAADHSRIGEVFRDISDLPADRRYQRITTIAALEHICDLPLALARAALHLTPDGTLRAAIPAEGGFLWTLGWMATTGLEFRLRHGLDYGDLMRHEHVNTAAEIETLARALFEDVQVKSFGIGRQLSLYRFFTAAKPRLDVARAWEARFA